MINLPEAIGVTEGLVVSKDANVSVPGRVTIRERISTGSLLIEALSESHIRVVFPAELRFNGTTNLGNFDIEPTLTSNGAHVNLVSVEQIFTTYGSGSSAQLIDFGNAEFSSLGGTLDFRGTPGYSTNILDFHGTAVFEDSDIGDYIEVLNGQSAGLYQIIDRYITNEDIDAPLPGIKVPRILVDRPLVVNDPVNGYLDGLAEVLDITSVGPDSLVRLRLNNSAITPEDPLIEVLLVENRTKATSATQPGIRLQGLVEFVDHNTFTLRVAGPSVPSDLNDRYYVRARVDSKLEWRHVSGVQELQFRTNRSPGTRLTQLEQYRFSGQGLTTKVTGEDYEFSSTFIALPSVVQRPRVASATYLPADGTLLVEFDQEMRVEDETLTFVGDYTITGPTTVTIKRVRSLSPTTVALETSGMSAGEYTLTVSTSTPKDVAGNPLDPTFNTVVYTAAIPETTRSVFTDKGPIAKPPLTIASGLNAVIETYNEVTLTGGTLTADEVGDYVTLSGGAVNGGTFRISALLSATRVRLANASFTLPDPNSGSLNWEVFDPRNGQLADDPADVTVRINGSPVTPESVIGLLGQVVLNAAPAASDTVDIDYSWCCNPTIEIRRLNSREFRLNSWNRDVGFPEDSSQHKYRYNNVLITPSLFEPDNPSAKLEQPLERELHYRAYERAYTPVLNDPSLLLLNSPIHKIAFPPAERTLSESFITYEGTGLPESQIVNAWERLGGGTASSTLGFLTITDDSTGNFPTGQPIYWTRNIDLTFDHVFAMSWRFSLDTVTTFEGVHTGVVAGYSDERSAVVVGFLEEGGVKKFGVLKKGFGDDPSLASAWTGGIDATDNPTLVAADVDWSVLRSYRLLRDQNGTISIFIDGDVDPTLRVTAADLPSLEEVNASFDALQGVFFGSLSRPAQNTSSWDFVRYLIQPTNPRQASPSSFVDYEANVLPDADPKPWTPVGFHGNSTILSTDFLLLDATSATDAATASAVGLVGGDYKGYVRFEPLLSRASEFVYDVNVQLLTHTHGVDPNGLTFAVDDGSRLMQVAFFANVSTPKLSYGGRSLPEDFSPFVWSSLGTATAALAGRLLRITDASTTDGKVYYIEDSAPVGLTFATGTMSSSVLNYNDGDTVTIDGKVYTFQTVLTNVDGNVALGAGVAATLSNLFAAINLGLGAGTAYAAATVIHPTVTATALGGDTITVTAKVGGPDGNLIAVSETIVGAEWDNPTLTGGSVGDDRVIAASVDYILESRLKVTSYVVDGSGFAGAFMQAFDGTRAVGLLLEEVAGVKRVAFHSDGVVISSLVFDWGDSNSHTYRLSKSTSGNLVSLFIDGVFVGSEAYSNFAAPPPNPVGQVSFGSSTPASIVAQSVVDWSYCNAWRVRSDQKTYVGLWKGSNNDSLLGYHLPTKQEGLQAVINGNTLSDANGDFIANSVVVGDALVVDTGPNQGVYEVASVIGPNNLTITTTWPSNPSTVDYRIVRETDWTAMHKYRLVRDPQGEVALFIDAVADPLIRVTYSSISLPTSGTGIIRTLGDGLPAIAFGSFSPENLAQSNWDFVRYGITLAPTEPRIAPHHQFLNQWNVMHSPERLFTQLPHTLTDFKSSSTGQPPKTDPDFLADPGLTAYTLLNEGTPLVPSTQSFEVRAPFPVQEFVSALNRPEDVLNSDGDFSLNDSGRRFRLIVPDDVLYSCLDVIEQPDTGVTSLIAPFDDDCSPNISGLNYNAEVCLEYDGSVLPELDTGAPTPWQLVSTTPGDVTASAFAGILTYSTAGSETIYRNDTPLPDAPSLQTEVRFRIRLLNDATGGTGDTQVRFGLSAPNMTLALAFLTTPLGERFVLVLDLNNGALMGSVTFDYLDGNFHDYRIVRDPSAGTVQIFIDS